MVKGFPGGTLGKNPPANAGDARDEIRSLGGEDPLEKRMETHSSILAWTDQPGGLGVHGVTKSKDCVNNTLQQ